MNVKKMMSLRQKNVVVTGAGGYIGQKICETIAELEGNIIAMDADQASLDRMKKKVEEERKCNVDTYACNLLEENDLLQALKKIKYQYECIDVVINNAGYTGMKNRKGWVGKFEEQSTDAWNEALTVNLTSPFIICRELKPNLEKDNGASVINIGSIYGSYGPDMRLYDNTKMGNPAGYAASKGGLLQLTRWMATVMAPNVRVNSISPGGIERGQPKKFKRRYISRTPLGRMGTEDDIKGAIAYLATSMSDWVTGIDIRVDGGWGAW